MFSRTLHSILERLDIDVIAGLYVYLNIICWLFKTDQIRKDVEFYFDLSFAYINGSWKCGVLILKLLNPDYNENSRQLLITSLYENKRVRIEFVTIITVLIICVNTKYYVKK